MELLVKEVTTDSLEVVALEQSTFLYVGLVVFVIIIIIVFFFFYLCRKVFTHNIIRIIQIIYKRVGRVTRGYELTGKGCFH